MSRYSQLTQVELEAEEAALTAALEAVRGKVRTAAQERASVIAWLDAGILESGNKDIVFALTVARNEILAGNHLAWAAPRPAPVISEGDD